MTLYKYLKTLNALNLSLESLKVKKNIVLNRANTEIISGVYNNDYYKYICDISENKMLYNDIIYTRLINHYDYKINQIKTKIDTLKQIYFKNNDINNYQYINICVNPFYSDI